MLKISMLNRRGAEAPRVLEEGNRLWLDVAGPS